MSFSNYNRLSRFIAGAIVICAAVASTIRSAPPPHAADRKKGEFIIQFRPEATDAEIETTFREAKLTLKRHLRTSRMEQRGQRGLTLVIGRLKEDETLALLHKNRAVSYAEPNFLYHLNATANDPVFTSGNLWGMYGANSTPANTYGSRAAEAWSQGYTGSRSVYVAIIDDGMQIAHSDLAPNVWTNPFDPVDGVDNDGNGYIDDIHGWNFFAESNVVYENQNDHGTHVAGTIGAVGGNGSGVAGINWNVTMIPLKFISGSTGTTIDAIEAIDYCIDLKTRHGVNLVAINASWGAGGYSIALHEAIIGVAKAGILFIAAAGNDGQDLDRVIFTPASIDTRFGTTTENPAPYNAVISVAAIDNSGNLASFSNYGSKKVHVGAPGVMIFSSFPPNTVNALSGTSMAAPHVTGAVALYASTHPTATAEQIRTAILGSVLPTPSLASKTTTGGRLSLSTVVAPIPAIQPLSASVTQETVPNGVLDAGELVTVQLTLTNATPFAPVNLIGTLQGSSEVLNPGAAQQFGSPVAGGASVSRAFTFVANGTCGKDITLTLALANNGNSLGTISFKLPVGTPAIVAHEDFDSVTPPNLPPGWTTTKTGAGLPWTTVAGSVHAADPDAGVDNLLISPIWRIKSASARLTFQNSFSFEPDWDGGILEISIGGGAFQDILAAGGSFIKNGYNWFLNNLTSPLPSHDAWSGNSGGFIETIVQLPSACLNQDVRLQWRCVSDPSVGGSGWSVDSISVTDGFVCPLPDQTVNEDRANLPLSFSIGEADSQGGLVLSASSSNPSLLPNANMNFSGSGPARTFNLAPAADESGTSMVTLSVQSAVATSYRTFHLTVSPVNDMPSFTKGSDLLVQQDANPFTIVGWATGISAGPPNEASQSLNFELTTEPAYLFSSLPTLAPNGSLAFTAAPHQRGTATVTIKLHDNGGTANSGIDTATESMTITVGDPTDSDGDGLPDDFELLSSLNPYDASDASLDFDGDGLNSSKEFLAGTDPSNARSLLRISPPENNDVESIVQFDSVAGRTYTVEENSDFPAGPWTPVGSAQVGTGAVLSRSDPGSSAPGELRRIYRVSTTGIGGQTVSSEYAGFCRLPLAGNSDTLLSIPFIRQPAELGAVAATSLNQVQFRGSLGWTSQQWIYAAGVQTNTYYLLVRSGALEGEFYTILGNSADTVMLDADPSELAGLSVGDAVAIVPYWTLGTIFPGGTSVHTSPGPASRRTEILFPNLASTGINPSAAATYYYWAGFWHQVGQGTLSKNDDVIPSDVYVIVRHNLATSTTVVTHGAVLPGKLHSYLRRRTAGQQDNIVALARPMNISLDGSGLIESGAFRASSSPANRVDELFFFNNNAIGKNKSAAATYYYWNGGWRKVGGGIVNFGSDSVFTPGTGVIIRTGPANTPALWENSPAF